jgi:hypothetical protein
MNGGIASKRYRPGSELRFGLGADIDPTDRPSIIRVSIADGKVVEDKLTKVLGGSDMGGPRITPDEMERVKQLRAQGLSFETIADRFGRNASALRRAYQVSTTDTITDATEQAENQAEILEPEPVDDLSTDYIQDDSGAITGPAIDDTHKTQLESEIAELHKKYQTLCNLNKWLERTEDIFGVEMAGELLAVCRPIVERAS